VFDYRPQVLDINKFDYVALN